MIFRHRLDISRDDLAAAAAALAGDPVPVPDAAIAAAAVAGGPETGAVLPCLSVRSGWELLLEALDLPAGSEVLASGVSIPDMARIPEAHGLRVRPVDIDPETLAPPLAEVERAIGPQTRVLLVAHLYGSRIDLRPYAALARAHGLVLVEDGAQAWAGPGWLGHAGADASLFSFGLAKTATALGGGLLVVRRPALVPRLRALHARWPLQDPAQVARRLASAHRLLDLCEPDCMAALVADCAREQRHLDWAVYGLVKGFPGPDLRRQIRHRPHPATRALLLRRLQNWDPARLAARARRGDALLARLPPGLRPLGHRAAHRTHWLLPVGSDGAAALLERLRAAGFDGSMGTTSIAALAPTGQPEAVVPRGAAMLASAVYVPAYPELPAREVDRLVEVLEGAAAA